MRIYISGPITGVPDFRERFAGIAQALRARGHTVDNPAENPPHLTLAQHMGRDLSAITESDAVFMLPGWGHSGGARLEKALADYLRIRVYSDLSQVPDLTRPTY